MEGETIVKLLVLAIIGIGLIAAPGWTILIVLTLMFLRALAG